MSRAWVLMTALPPTTGHLDLIRFAAAVADGAEVVLCTQPGEPFSDEREQALRAATGHLPVRVHRLHRILQQEPVPGPDGDDPAFWAMWRELLLEFGLRPGVDCLVASEAYGAELARRCGVSWRPYDLGRELNPAKATRVREDLAARFADVLPTFQPLIRPRVTVFGAESTGKTTLSRALADELGGHWLFEYARPYLEAPGIGAALSATTMHGIWTGQRALQATAHDAALGRPFLVQDTDLFSTVGYWQMWDPAGAPAALVRDALAGASDLYLVLRSNIPFEPDPLRYGGDHREGSDEFWLELCRRYQLPHMVLDSADHATRLAEAVRAGRDLVDTTLARYQRIGAEYGVPVAVGA